MPSSTSRDTIETILSRFIDNWINARHLQARIARGLLAIRTEGSTLPVTQIRTFERRTQALRRIKLDAFEACTHAGYRRTQIEPVWNRLTVEAIADHEDHQARFTPRRRRAGDRRVQPVGTGEGGPVDYTGVSTRSPESYGESVSDPDTPSTASGAGRRRGRVAQGAAESVPPTVARRLDLTLEDDPEREGERESDDEGRR